MARSVLQTEIKQTKPFASPEEEAYLNLLRSHGILLGFQATLMKSHGLSHPQYNVMRILRGAGTAGLHCLEISDRMVTRVPDITRLLDRLDKSDLILRTRSREDRRVVNVKLTAKGTKLLKSLDKPVQQTLKEALGHMNRGELNELSRLLEKARSP